MNTIVDYFKNNVRDSPKKTALIYDKQILSYEQLNKLVSSTSASISNLEKKSVVSIFIENSSDFIISYLGVLNAGLIAHLIPTYLSNQKIKQQLDNANPSLIISSNSLIDKINDIQYKCKKVVVTELTSNKFMETFHNSAVEDIACLIYTSGTTANPKGVSITHSNYVFTTNNIIKILNYNKSDINILPLPLSHSFGLGCLHASLFVGATLVVLENAMDTMLILESIKKNSATTLAAIPLTLTKILKEHNSIISDYLSRIRLIITNSTSIPVETVKNYQKILKNGKLATYYGLTEASRSTFMVFDGLGKENSVGISPEGIEIKIQNDSSNELESGEILIKGKNVITKYWNNVQADENIIDNWLRTGDLGHKDSDGYLYLDGRLDNLINTAGEKVLPEDIEKVVKVLTGIDDVIAVGVKNEMFGQVVKIFVQKSFYSKITKSDILTHCIKNLERFKVPREIEFVENFSRNEFGKIQRFKLQQ